jgi:STE24 endopeptidase
MAHEMGHYVLNHIYKLLGEMIAATLVFFALTKLVFEWAVRRHGARWQVTGIADPAGLPLLSLILTVLFFLYTPISNSLTRETEAEADSFGINTSREPDGFAQASLKLGEYRKLDPGPLEEFIFFDHPSGRARIRKAMDWKAAHLPAGD